MANDKSIAELARDVEQARARVAADLARLRAPEMMDWAKRDVMDAATGYRDGAMGVVRDQVGMAAQGFLESIKAKVAANPAATLAIAAGVGWRLYRHPPIASVLIGAGLAGLLRTNREDEAVTARRLAQAVAEKATALKDRASVQIAELTENATGAAQERLHEWSAAAERAYDDMTDRISHGLAQATGASVAPEPAAPVSSTSALEEEPRRNAYLLGFAALALGAAMGVARHRREDEEPFGQRRHTAPTDARG